MFLMSRIHTHAVHAHISNLTHRLLTGSLRSLPAVDEHAPQHRHDAEAQPADVGAARRLDGHR